MKSKFQILIPILFLLHFSSAHTQDRIKLDIFPFLKSGLGVGYEHNFSKRISSEIYLRNTSVEPQCFSVFDTLPYCIPVDDVARDWTIIFNVQYLLTPRSKKHHFAIGLGVEYYKWYSVSEEFLTGYEEYTNRPFEQKEAPIGLVVPAIEYRYLLGDKLGIGFNYFAIGQNGNKKGLSLELSWALGYREEGHKD